MMTNAYRRSAGLDGRGTGQTGTTLLQREAASLVQGGGPRHLFLTVIEGGTILFEVDLLRFNKQVVTFGAAPDNDIRIASSYGIVSSHHGAFVLRGSSCAIEDRGSTNGTFVNGARQAGATVAPGDVVSIGDLHARAYDCTLMLLSYEEATWRMLDLSDRTRLSVGRAPDNDLVFGTSSVSSHHALFTLDQTGRWLVTDLGSFNGISVSGSMVAGTASLARGDVVSIANATVVFMGSALICGCSNQGVDVLAKDLVQVRRVRGGERVTTDHVSLHIKRGEFVAILGGSGAGKSTLLDELNGTDRARSGTVLVDGVDLYANYGTLKNGIGYVPQRDIVYDDLRLIDMLRYAAELRMTPDTSPSERERRCAEVLDQLELAPFRDQYIRSLSGGQRKRASIAVEMLADPRLFFLDEPTSGLDPGIEKSLMRKLAALAHGGRTVIVVTHTTLNIGLCDRVVFMGTGGVLCFEGSPEDAKAFFGVEDFVDIYDLISADPAGWARCFAQRDRSDLLVAEATRQAGAEQGRRSPSLLSQTRTLAARYRKLIFNDRARFALLLLQAPILSALICAVAGSGCFDVYESTKSCLFSLACAAFWIGILNSIQEVCKERTVLKREYAGGLKLSAYLASKIIVLGALCVVQALLLTAVFVAFEGVPGDVLVNGPLELGVTAFLVMFSAMCLGLMVSAMFTNADRAIALAPILIMPQILFSGLVFELKGLAKTVSILVNCRWGMEAFGTSADLNALDLRIYRENDAIDASIYEHEWEAAYDFTVQHLVQSWGVLLAFCVVCIAACGILLRARVRK